MNLQITETKTTLNDIKKKSASFLTAFEYKYFPWNFVVQDVVIPSVAKCFREVNKIALNISQAIKWLNKYVVSLEKSVFHFDCALYLRDIAVTYFPLEVPLRKYFFCFSKKKSETFLYAINLILCFGQILFF